MTNLELLRRDHRLTQAQLAEKAGVSRVLIAQIEDDTIVPLPDVLERLAYALCFSPPERLLRPVCVEPDDEEQA